MSDLPPNKKRKVVASLAKPRALSAFAARKALNSKQNNLSLNNADETLQNIVPTPVSASSSVVRSLITHNASSLLRKDTPSAVEAMASVLEDATLSREDSQLSSYGFESRGQSPEIPVDRPCIAFSNFKPNRENIQLLPGNNISLHLSPGERLVILGQYDLSVRKGQVTLMGATLPPSKVSHHVYAPSSHALPVIRCLATDVYGADIRLRQCDNGLRSLDALSPLYGKLWNDNCGPLGAEYQHILGGRKESTFQILFSSRDGPQKLYLQPLISPPLWNEMLAKCSTSLDEKTRTVLICGPKSSGKSTFTKLLVNRLLSIHIEKGKTTKPAKVPGVALLDIDPGQPEYCPPSQLALVHIQEPNFAPPFAHPIPGPKSKIIRSHSIGAVSPSLDPELYMACVLNLFGHYRNLLLKFPNCPLVINTPGWVLGTGLEILVDLIAKISPTEVIYMSKDGPPEVVESLTEAAASNPVLTLPSQASEYTTRTAAHLRTMQYMSYFHLNPSRDKESTWITQPLTSLPPWEIRYSGDKPGIVGIICYGEQPPASLVADKINGSLVAILVIDSLNSISGWSAENQTRPSDTSGNGADESDDIDTKSETDWEHCGLSQKIQLPLILRTPEDIPYFNPANAITFDPTTSHSIGLALVRGIDKARRRIQVLTPIAPSVIEKINKAEKLMVLVSGKLDTPGWAYIEEFTQKMTLEKSSKRVEAGDVGRPEESNLGEVEDVEGLEERRTLGDGFKGAPWIEAIEGSEGRGIGSRVWRVRRDLGRDSGD